MSIMVTLPTYNESANILPLIDELLAVQDDISVVVIDDDSPDGTHRLVRERQKKDPRVHLIHRTGERGRGTAGAAGFKYAVAQAADLIVEMDADFSHHPRFLPALLNAAQDADVVIGSRLMAGGGETGRSFIRRIITHLANSYIRLVLGLKVRDCTSGYRVFRRAVLEAIQLDTLTAKGPAIVQEVLFRCGQHGFRMVEVPIVFEERKRGKSTFNWRIILTGLWSVLKFRFRG
ncbi:MAG: polyprenol monophosphomannose synthase [Candidatus Sumerlaeota bacterium]|nr:polyprenol monophosphomannose synthase [Candidatus Sumerlaeota bacterium]